MTMLKDQPHPQDSQARSAGNPLRELQKLGQSFWLDYISRRLISGGELQRLIAEDQLSGITSNPSIFEKAIAGGTDYDDFLDRAAKCKEHDAMALYEGLAIRDIQDAADALRPTYERTERVDGYVSLEVSPYLAHDTKGTWPSAPPVGQGRARKPLDQGSSHARGPSRHPAAHRRGNQRQYYAAVLSEGVRASCRDYTSKPWKNLRLRAGRREPDGQRGEFLCQPHRHVGRCPGGSRRLRPLQAKRKKILCDRSWAVRPWPTQSWPTRCSRKSSAARAGRPLPRRAPTSSGYCGPAPARRTPSIAT